MNELAVERLLVEVPGRTLLSDVSFSARKGECVALVGPSGVGKTSLLNCVSGISRPRSGSVRIGTTELTSLRPNDRAMFRLKHIGTVFQFGELLPELTLLENVALPLRLLNVPRKEAAGRARRWLDHLELETHAHARPEELSGGEIQRAAIARALIHGPGLVLADEPTGMLDEQTTDQIARLLIESTKPSGQVVLIATHDATVASMADRVLRLADGTVRELPATDSVTDSVGLGKP